MAGGGGWVAQSGTGGGCNDKLPGACHTCCVTCGFTSRVCRLVAALGESIESMATPGATIETLLREPGPRHRRDQREVKLVMRAYELMVIFEGEVDDATIQGHMKSLVTDNVEAAGGRVATVDNWGKRRFAYRINLKWEGTYVVLEILLPEGRDLSGVDRALRLADDVVRQKIIRLPEAEATRRGLLGAGATA